MRWQFLHVFILGWICFQACNVQRTASSPLIAREYILLYPSIRSISLDPLGNLFVISDQDKVSKIDSSGQLLFNFANPLLGNLHSIDVGNPFKILLFFRDQQIIIIADNTLSEIQRIHLAERGFQDITAAGLSADNSMWLFDATSRQLIKADELLRPVYTSASFDIIRPSSERPDYIFNTHEYVITHQAGYAFDIFDEFANYISSSPIIRDQYFITDEGVFYHSDDVLTLAGFDNDIITTWKISGQLDHTVFPYHNGWISYDRKGIFLVSAY